MNPFDIFIPILINPLINILLAFYQLADKLGLPGPLGWSIIFLTIAIRLVVYPFYSSQLRHQKRLNELKPHLAELKRKYGSDRRRHQEEQAKLYKEQGINPAGGCLPLLIQFPVLIGLYNVFFTALRQAPEAALQHLNSAAYSDSLRITTFNETFFGLSLTDIPSHHELLSAWLLIPLLTGALQLVLAKMTQPPAAPAKKSSGESFEDALASSQSTMLYLFPVMTAYFSFSFPLGLTLYWNVANIFAIIQQYQIAGPGGLSKWLPKKLTPVK